MLNYFVTFGNSKEFTGTLTQMLAPNTQTRTRTRSGQGFFVADTLSNSLQIQFVHVALLRRYLISPHLLLEVHDRVPALLSNLHYKSYQLQTSVFGETESALTEIK